jgi:hypothetical protein
VVDATLQPLYFEEEPPTPIVGEAGWISQSVWMDMKKKNSLALTRVETPYHQPTANCQTNYVIWATITNTVNSLIYLQLFL